MKITMTKEESANFTLKDAKYLADLSSQICPSSQLEVIIGDKENTANPWISVKDRLPNEDGLYLVCNVYSARSRAHICNFALCLEEISDDFEGSNRPGFYEYDFNYDTGSFEDYEIEVTHWMSLPKPPRR